MTNIEALIDVIESRRACAGCEIIIFRDWLIEALKIVDDANKRQVLLNPEWWTATHTVGPPSKFAQMPMYKLL